MVDTMVLEAIVERRESSSLSWGTKFLAAVVKSVDTRDLKSLVERRASSSLASRTIKFASLVQR